MTYELPASAEVVRVMREQNVDRETAECVAASSERVKRAVEAKR